MFSNARNGARDMHRNRWALRKTLWERRAWRGLRNMIFPRLTYHWIYAKRFGLRAWATD